MSIKKMTVAASLVFGFGSQAFADDYTILLETVDQTIHDVNAMNHFLRSGAAGTTDEQNGGGGGGMPNFPSNGGGGAGGCTFCLTDNVAEEGDVNAALGIMQEVGQSLFKARNHILAMPMSSGTEYNYNKSFACSYLGDASIDVGSASLALGYPQNLNPQWKGKEQSSVFRIDRGRQLANCP
jgi:hypothetical protein